MTRHQDIPEPERPAIPPNVILGGRHRVPWWLTASARQAAWFAVGFLGGALLVLGALALSRVVHGG